MRYLVDADHRRFFHQNGYIQFSELLSIKDLQDLRGAASQELNAILQRPGKKSQRLVVFEQGRDVWRRNAGIQKITCSRKVAQTAAELLDVQPLQLAYDQLLEAGGSSEQGKPFTLAEKLHNDLSLAERSSFQGLVGGWILCLDGPEELEGEIDAFLPRTAGAMVFFKADHPLDFSELLAETERPVHYLMVAYGSQPLVYVQNSDDSHTHALKDLQYVFGDRMKETTHPVLTRR